MTVRRQRSAAVLIAVALTLRSWAMAGAGLPGAAAADPPGNGFDSAPPSFTDAAPGAVLRTREVTIGIAGVATPLRATQALYRTTDQQGAPSTTVTTVVRPPTAPAATRLVSFHTAYDGLGAACDPSYTLQGDDPTRVTVVEQTAMARYLAAGYTLVVSDYEGPDLEWTVGRQSGYAALDGIRAAESVLRLPRSTPVGLVGYSGGSVPTDYAAEVAPRYAPELRIVGAAAGGLPVELAHNLPYVSGSSQWAGVIPAIVVAYQRAYGLDTSSFLSPRGTQLTSTVADECIAAFAARYPGLTDAEMVRGPFRSLLDVPAVAAALNDNIMGTAGTPRIPMFLGVGHSDATGDSVMITGDVRTLGRTFCGRGVRVDFHTYEGKSHGAAYVPFAADGFDFLAARFAGRPAIDTCAVIAPGPALAPIPVP
ncbi:lipase family protein [Gordonia sp. DT219]|uniref:lipase family protein n=1 Tax=Gordonia sp. DT219 TaxID=3416658 RepID=UPI003CF0D1B1